MTEVKKCGCGKTKNANGNCDGSHNTKKETPFSAITIRVLGTKTQKVKFVYPAIANNRQLMKNMDFVISDPNYDAKMEAFKNKKSFSENGQSKEAVKEAFAPKIEEIQKVEKTEQSKNEIETPKIEGEKPKRIRRTKAEIEAANKLKSTVTT